MLKQLSPQEMKEAMEQSIPALLTEEKRQKYRISEEQEQNLRKLVIGLERLLPTHEDVFNINRYAEVGGDEAALNGTIEHPCETAACAIGYGPSCGIPIIGDEGWVNYSDRVFGALSVGIINLNIQDFMFSSNWQWTIHDSPMREAIARIKLVLAGKAPDEFDYTETYA